MARDLGPQAAEVHKEAIWEQADAVLAFWLADTPPDKRFARDDALDAEIAGRFGALIDAVAACHGAGWRAHPRTLLAAVILLDQFSRNIRRGRADAFANDPLARALTGEAIAKGWDKAMSDDERHFLYMPLMHCERLDDQLRGLPLFDRLGDNTADFARRHCAQIARFGRFPGRNAALGRTSTPEEVELLRQPGAGF
ncbi:MULTISPECIES: DUF924 family protein [Edaphosphingomonas]|uniref:DUF924 domain-containing protein n=2 Tax=Edaphosphingomonas TaxID=3423724 RepID=A0A2T4I6G4_9SPHN|nr:MULTISPECIES: DUF924 family protein [Sphingomonas]OHT20817.1 hypothetical protein BHE75_02820 [Sphingomonas haloaromaticamans]PTD26155.1 DUF924 domain-containing protein [Sphingomonas fennica]